MYILCSFPKKHRNLKSLQRYNSLVPKREVTIITYILGEKIKGHRQFKWFSLGYLKQMENPKQRQNFVQLAPVQLI